MSEKAFRWQKFAPIDRAWPIFELLDGETIILDVTKSNDDRLEIAFHNGAAGRVIDLATLERLLEEAKARLANETPM